jgi:hypothetical protein
MHEPIQIPPQILYPLPPITSDWQNNYLGACPARRLKKDYYSFLFNYIYYLFIAYRPIRIPVRPTRTTPCKYVGRKVYKKTPYPVFPPLGPACLRVACSPFNF